LGRSGEEKMTRDEIRSLIGGYATGSLSAAERSALFEAALDHQELFDELAREQALKELLDAPGVKARLMAAVAPRRENIWWKSVWAWAAAGAFATAVIAGIVLFKTSPPPQELARVIVPSTPGPPPIAPTAVVPPPVVSPPVVPPQVIPPPVIQKEAAPPVPAAAPKIVAPASAPSPTPEPALPKAEAAPAPPPAAQANAAADSQTVYGAVSVGALAGGGGRGGAATAATSGAIRAQSLAALAAKPPRLAFDYRLTPEGVLRIEPASAGFLTVEVSDTLGSFMPLFTDRPVAAGSVNEIMLPSDAVTALTIFGPRTAASYGSIVHGAMDPPSGTKSDPNPTPNSFLVSEIPVKR
jgi:outer membrane biosynthesis protein TonB